MDESDEISDEANRIAHSVPRDQIFGVIRALDLRMADCEFTSKLVGCLLQDLSDELEADPEDLIRELLDKEPKSQG